MINRLMRGFGSIPRDYVLLAVLAFGTYLPGYWWGAPHATGPERVQSWGVDDGTPLQPLADIHNIYPRTAEGHLELAALLLGFLADCMTALGLAAAVGGLAIAVRRRSRAALLALTAATYLVVLFVSVRSSMLRYLMSAALILLMYAAAFVGSGLRSGRVRARVVGLMSFLIFGVGFLRGMDLTYAMVNDSRFAAGAWIETHVRPGSTIEFFGPSSALPPIPIEIQPRRATRFLGAIYRARRDDEAAREVIQGWEQRRPEYILLLPDHSSSPGEPYSATGPPQVYAALTSGRLGYRLAAQFETDALLPWVRGPTLDYPTVNPPVRIFARNDLAAAIPPKGKPD